MRKLLLAVVVVATMLMMSAPAFAGEWNSGHFNEPGGDLPAKYNGNSECLFNGLDEPDESAPGEGDGEPLFPQGFGDDLFWGEAPAKGKVQSAGQAIVIGIAEPGDAGEACNGHLNPLK